MDWKRVFDKSLGYEAFLGAKATPVHRDRWQAVYDLVRLNPEQKSLLTGFTRQMNVFCLAGAWCGDCVSQCPVLQRIAEASPLIDLRFLDRDEDAAVRAELSINGGQRVPAVVFLSEDFYECSRYGDRTLAVYRQLAGSLMGAACPTGLASSDERQPAAVTADWLDEFERIQLMLRLSARLRGKHGD